MLQCAIDLSRERKRDMIYSYTYVYAHTCDMTGRTKGAGHGTSHSSCLSISHMHSSCLSISHIETCIHLCDMADA